MLRHKNYRHFDVCFFCAFLSQKGGNYIMNGHKPIPIHDLREANALRNKEQWLKWRKEGIGGSDSAAARGKGKFKSTLELFLEKTSNFQREPTNWESLLCGQLLEPYARRMFSYKTGLRVIESPYMYQHPDYPFMLADLDGFVMMPDGSMAILECKVINAFTKKFYGTKENPKLPYQYEAQVRHYMCVMDMDVAYVIAIYGNTRNDVIIRKVTRNMMYEKIMIEELKEFWQKVQNNEEPDVFEDKDPDLLIKALEEKKYVDGTIELPYGPLKSLLEQYDTLMEERRAIQKNLNEVDQSLNRIKAYFINSLKGVDNTRYDRGIIFHGDEKIILKYEQKEPEVTFSTESSQRLAEMYPDIYQKFCTAQKQSPRFSLKKEKI